MSDWVEIHSAQNERVKHWVKLRTQRRYRAEQQRALVVGRNLVQELADKGLVRTLIGSSDQVLHLPAVEKILVSEAVIKKVTGLEQPDGWAAELELPAPAQMGSQNRVLVLDRVSDPGNLGTLLRTALAFGWKAAFLLDGTVDPFNEKALRAAKGATFQMELASGSVDDLHRWLAEGDYQVLVADMGGQAPEQLNAAEKTALVLGQEGGGVEVGLLPDAMRVGLPMNEEMESLNVGVAGAILMYLMKETKKTNG